jgi:hypothetical protein
VEFLLQILPNFFCGVQPNENPGTPLIPVELNEPNYHSWSRAMCVALKIKNKLQFVNGGLPKPYAADPNFEAWDRCNLLVIAWINQTLSPSISESISEKTNYNHDLPEETLEKKLFDHVPQHNHKDIMKKKTKKRTNQGPARK